jgi:hypothetical protein
VALTEGAFSDRLDTTGVIRFLNDEGAIDSLDASGFGVKSTPHPMRGRIAPSAPCADI